MHISPIVKNTPHPKQKKTLKKQIPLLSADWLATCIDDVEQATSSPSIIY